MCCLFELSIIIIVCTSIVMYVKICRKKKHKRVFVVVLGDIGRSPRIQFHSMSLAKDGFEVYIFGYKGSEPYCELLDNESVHLVHVRPFPALFYKLPRLFVFVLKVVWQSISLTLSLLTYSGPSHILLQNPPSLPTMAVCWLVSCLYRCQFIIDWHNYGYTLLAIQLGNNHALVKLHKWYEHLFGRLSTSNICVTDAMRDDLLQNWKIRATTMHDRPASMFSDISLINQHQLFHKLDIFQVAPGSSSSSCTASDGEELTVMTRKTRDGRLVQRDDRPALLVSSTSWTEDEDFSLLLNSLDVYDKSAADDHDLPSLICVITGKGPLKEHYMKLISRRCWSHVNVYTPWLESADYPQLLSSADLGVCLHRSSSGLDLPMKVVDMFGCRLPVCALQFPCLHELVEHDRNGAVFSTESELANQLQELLRGFPEKCHRLREYKENLRTFQQLRWDDVWSKSVQPLFV